MEHVLFIVDDNEANNLLLQRRLEQLEYKVCTATSGEECLRRIEKIQPDLILLDLKMPGLDGWQTIEKLKANEKTKNFNVVAVSSTLTQDDADRVRHAGFTAFCIKPIKVKEFIPKVKKWIQADDFDIDSVDGFDPIEL